MLPPVIVALLLALALGAAWLGAGRRGFGVAAALWLAYAGYEFLMYRRVLCSGECNIRVDLLLFYPILLAATLWPIVGALWRALRRRGTIRR
jgi:hypothetical protein